MTINTSPYAGHGIAVSLTDDSVSSFLFAGETPTGTKTFPSVGTAIAAFAPVGRVTASGKIITSLASAVDGSQNPIGVAVEAVPAGADKPVIFWYEGTFFLKGLAWDASWTTDAAKLKAFEAANPQIAVKDVIA